MSEFKLNTPDEVANNYFGNRNQYGLGKVYGSDVIPTAPPKDVFETGPVKMLEPKPYTDMETGPVKMLKPEPEKKKEPKKEKPSNKVVSELTALAKDLKEKLDAARSGRGGPNIPTPRSSLDPSDYARQADSAIGYQMVPTPPPGIREPIYEPGSVFETRARDGIAKQMTAEPSLLQDYNSWSKSSQPQDSGYKMNAGNDESAIVRMTQIWEKATRNQASPGEMKEYQELAQRVNTKNSEQNR